MKRSTRAGRWRFRRRSPPRHLARPGPTWADVRRGFVLWLWMVLVVAFFINVAESGLAEIVYPTTVTGFLRIARAGPDVYRLALAGRTYYLNASYLRATVSGLGARLGSGRRPGSSDGPPNTLVRDG